MSNSEDIRIVANANNPAQNIAGRVLGGEGMAVVTTLIGNATREDLMYAIAAGLQAMRKAILNTVQDNDGAHTQHSSFFLQTWAPYWGGQTVNATWNSVSAVIASYTLTQLRALFVALFRDLEGCITQVAGRRLIENGRGN